jgi:hypothetical protein
MLSAQAQYRPPNEGGEEQQTEVQGTRRESCISVKEFPQLLAPKNHIAVTASAPKVLVHFPATFDVPVQIILNDQQGKVWYQKQIQAKSGINFIQLPKREQKLPEGNYYWTLVIQCRSELALNPYARVEFQYRSLNLSPKLKSDPIRLAEQGLWYDAIALAYRKDNDLVFQKLLCDAKIKDDC